jgi:DNA-binding transcriptional LysR family regulator
LKTSDYFDTFCFVKFDRMSGRQLEGRRYMNLRQVETFYWAAKLGSFSAASERLSATQSTVSVRIRDIERDLGVLLFDRTQRAVRITPKGRELLRYAEELLRVAAQMRERMSEDHAVSGVLRVGVVEMVSVTWLPRLVKAIHEKYPRITLELDEALTQDLIDRLNQGSLDLILAAGTVPGYSFTPVSLGTVDFAWMASYSLKLPKGVLTPRDLQNHPIIALSRESYHHKSIEDWFQFGGAIGQRIDTCKSLSVAASLASAGLGLALLPPRSYARQIKSKQLRIVPTDPSFPPVEFTATCSVESMQRTTLKIAQLASEISDFDNRPVARRQGSRQPARGNTRGWSKTA